MEYRHEVTHDGTPGTRVDIYSVLLKTRDDNDEEKKNEEPRPDINRILKNLIRFVYTPSSVLLPYMHSNVGE